MQGLLHLQKTADASADKREGGIIPIPSPSVDLPRPFFWVTSSTEQAFKGRAGVICVSGSYPAFHLGFQTSMYILLSLPLFLTTTTH